MKMNWLYDKSLKWINRNVEVERGIVKVIRCLIEI